MFASPHRPPSAWTLASVVVSSLLGAAAGCGSAPAEPAQAPREKPRSGGTEVALPPAEAPSPTVAAASAPLPAATDPGAPSAPSAPSAPEPPPIPPSTAVLHVGDSMVHSGLAQALRPRFKKLAVRYEVRGEQSTFTSTWAGRMDELVAATQPDLVIITLGGNEIGNIQPESHARFVRRIVNATKGRPCVWMTAPLWRHETGIYDVIQKNSAPCRFFETDRFLTAPIERRGDKIHPTAKGGEDWATLFWAWLMKERIGGEKPWALRPGSDEEYAPRGLRTAPTFPSPAAALPSGWPEPRPTSRGGSRATLPSSPLAAFATLASLPHDPPGDAAID